MIPSALGIAWFWVICHHWLGTLSHRYRHGARGMLVLGVLATLFLILYTLALGVQGDYYRSLRRTGVILALTFTYLAQLLLARQLIYLHAERLVRLPAWARQLLVGLCITLLVAGIVSLLLEAFYAGYDLVEDAFEWFFALLLHSYFTAIYFVWRDLGMEVRLEVRNPTL